MCRYAFFEYKPHLACFECRKMFRRRLLSDIDRLSKESTEAKCPQCGGLMADMGLDFKAPQKIDIKAWAHIHDLYKVGITFHSCGCSGPGYIPKSKAEIIFQLEKTKKRYIKNLRLWNTIVLPKEKKEMDKFRHTHFQRISGSLPREMYNDYKKNKVDQSAAIQYWSERIKLIDEQITILE